MPKTFYIVSKQVFENFPQQGHKMQLAQIHLALIYLAFILAVSCGKF